MSMFANADEARIALQNPGLSAQDLYALVQDFPELTAEAARHPNAYAELREWAAGQQDSPMNVAGSMEQNQSGGRSSKTLIWVSVAIAGAVALALVAWFVFVPMLNNDDREQALELVSNEEQARQDVLDARDDAVEVLNGVLTKTESLGDKTYLEIEDTAEHRDELEQVMTSADSYFALVKTVSAVETELPKPTTTKKEVEEQGGGELTATNEEMRDAIEICTGLLDEVTLGIDEVSSAVEEKSRGDAEVALNQAIAEGETVYSESAGQVDDESLRETLRTLLDEGDALFDDAEARVADLDAKREQINAATNAVDDASHPSLESMLGGYTDLDGFYLLELSTSELKGVGTSCAACEGVTNTDLVYRFSDTPTWNGECFEAEYSSTRGKQSTMYICAPESGRDAFESRNGYIYFKDSLSVLYKREPSSER